MTHQIGDRVRTLFRIESAPWATEQPDLPVGALGTVDHIFSDPFNSNSDPDAPENIRGYGVLLDGSVDRLSCWIHLTEIEAAR